MPSRWEEEERFGRPIEQFSCLTSFEHRTKEGILIY